MSKKDDRTLVYVLAGLGLVAILAGLYFASRRQNQPSSSSSYRPPDFSQRSGGMAPGGRHVMASESYSPETDWLPPSAAPPEARSFEEDQRRYRIAGELSIQDMAILRHYHETGMLSDPLANVLGDVPDTIRDTLLAAQEAQFVQRGLSPIVPGHNGVPHDARLGLLGIPVGTIAGKYASLEGKVFSPVRSPNVGLNVLGFGR